MAHLIYIRRWMSCRAMETMEVAEPKVMTAETEATPTAEVEKDLLVMTITTCHDLSCICQVSANSTASKKCVSFIFSFYLLNYPTRNLCQPVIQIVTRNQGLVNVPFLGYWTSPYSSHYRPIYLMVGWCSMGTWLMTLGNHHQNDPNAANAIVPHDLGVVVDANHCSSNLAWQGLAEWRAVSAGPLPGSFSQFAVKSGRFMGDLLYKWWFSIEIISSAPVFLEHENRKPLSEAPPPLWLVRSTCQALSTQPQICLPLSSARGLGGPGENHRDPGDPGDPGDLVQVEVHTKSAPMSKKPPLDEEYRRVM